MKYWRCDGFVAPSTINLQALVAIPIAMLQLASSEQTKIMAQWPKVPCQGANIQPLFLQVSHLCLKRPHRQWRLGRQNTQNLRFLSALRTVRHCLLETSFLEMRSGVARVSKLRWFSLFPHRDSLPVPLEKCQTVTIQTASLIIRIFLLRWPQGRKIMWARPLGGPLAARKMGGSSSVEFSWMFITVILSLLWQSTLSVNSRNCISYANASCGLEFLSDLCQGARPSKLGHSLHFPSNPKCESWAKQALV